MVTLTVWSPKIDHISFIAGALRSTQKHTQEDQFQESAIYLKPNYFNISLVESLSTQ